jgi:AbrB family looped-hinge helix DNA binding protein
VKTSVSTKGQVVLPAELRARDAIEPGQEFVIERIDRGEYRLVRIEPRNEGLVDWLLSCPDKGYFVPIESRTPLSSPRSIASRSVVGDQLGR